MLICSGSSDGQLVLRVLPILRRVAIAAVGILVICGASRQAFGPNLFHV